MIELIIMIMSLIYWDRPWNRQLVGLTSVGPVMLQNLLKQNCWRDIQVTNPPVSISSHVFVLCAGLLLGHRQQPKGGCLAHAAKEEAEVWRTGESADKNTSFSIWCFLLQLLSLCLLGFSALLCLCLQLCTSASVSFPCALFSLPLYSTVSLPHANTHTHTQAQ